MKNSLLKFVWLVGCLGMIISLSNCGEVLEDNITSDEVFLRVPANGVTLTSDTVTFWWDHVDGALDYQIQVVSPSFDSARHLVADSFVVNNRLTLILHEGDFEWAVRALNNGYETAFFYSRFSIAGGSSSDSTDVDISTMAVVLNTPADGAQREEGSINFWWDEVDGASQYQIQVARPSFTSPEELVYDTVTTSTTLSLDLTPGEYQWRVKASNDGFQTAYTTNSLSVTAAAVTENPVITLVSPGDEYRTNEQSVTFRWSFSETVDFYVLRIEGPTDLDFVTESQQLSVGFETNDGDYTWNVTGVNAASSTNYYSDTLSFTYTSGIPSAPVLGSPADGAVVSLPHEFTWSRQLDNIVRDSVFVYAADTLVAGYPVGVAAEIYIVQGLSAGAYEWSVKSTDNQGQTSEESAKRGFTVQ